METIYLIAGLGNPGEEYASTRHNAGFMVLERLGNLWQAQWTLEKQFCSRIALVKPQGKRVILCCPQTYMNLSGKAVVPIVNYYRIDLKNLLVVADDADLPLGCLRMRPKGSSGGHHGLDSIETMLGSRDYARLRIGIGREPNSPRQITNHVLGKFNKDEMKVLDLTLENAVKQIQTWLFDGIEKAMNKFNGQVTCQKQE
ncbi:MAG: aminoacyl-tRNA hydrolase [Verrucomicrobiae bacterium]|nr:aminoacyl-tRNA hydrolase [Verrucomicrobiae bacterium]